MELKNYVSHYELGMKRDTVLNGFFKFLRRLLGVKITIVYPTVFLLRVQQVCNDLLKSNDG